MLLVGQQEGRPGVVICLDPGPDLHIAQLMPLSLTVSCFSKVQIVFTFLVPAHLGSPGQRAVNCVCVVNMQTASCFGEFSAKNAVSACVMCITSTTTTTVLRSIY